MPRGSVLHIAWVRWWSALAYYAFSMADGMVELGRSARIVAPPETPLGLRAAERGMEAPEFVDLGSSSPIRLLRAIRRLRRAAEGGEVRAVIVHTGVGHVAAAFGLRGKPVPLLRTRAEIRLPAGGPLQRWLHRRWTDRVLASGDFMHASLQKRLGVDPERITTLPAGIDLERVGPVDREQARCRLREASGWPIDALVVGMLARYSPVKGHRELIDAARGLAESHPDARFYLAGPQGQVGREQVERWVREAGLGDRFAIHDRVEEPLQVAAGFDVAVIASLDSEAVCRSALEYMALGLPIVATSVHVIPETIGEAGRIVEPGSGDVLRESIGRLLGDADLRAVLGSAARERVEKRYDRLMLAHRTLEILEEVEKERRQR